MRKSIINCILGFSMGAYLAHIGFTLDTMQFWIIIGLWSAIQINQNF